MPIGVNRRLSDGQRVSVHTFFFASFEPARRGEGCWALPRVLLSVEPTIDHLPIFYPLHSTLHNTHFHKHEQQTHGEGLKTVNRASRERFQ